MRHVTKRGAPEAPHEDLGMQLEHAFKNAGRAASFCPNLGRPREDYGSDTCHVCRGSDVERVADEQCAAPAWTPGANHTINLRAGENKIGRASSFLAPMTCRP